jgi:hypothetical protein
MGPGVTQLPLPLQVGAAVNWEEFAGQEVMPEPQLVPLTRCTHPPEPSQTPVLPQVVLTVHWPDGAAWLAAIAEQVPRPLRLHDWQVPQLLLEQQTPSVQFPLPHSSATAQLFPRAFRGVQAPPAVQ